MTPPVAFPFGALCPCGARSLASNLGEFCALSDPQDPGFHDFSTSAVAASHPLGAASGGGRDVQPSEEANPTAAPIAKESTR